MVDEHPILGIKYLLDKKLKPFLQVNFYFVNFGNICVEVSIPRWSPNPKEIILAGRAGFDLGLTCLTTFFLNTVFHYIFCCTVYTEGFLVRL